MKPDKLTEFATVALKHHNNDVETALPKFLRAVQAAKLIDDLARAFLRSVAMRGSGQKTPEAPEAVAGLTPSGSIKVKAHDVRQHRRRTPEEKEAARRVALASAEAVFEMKIGKRKLGSLHWGELVELKRQHVHEATTNLMLGIKQVETAILLEKLDEHCTVTDTMALVRDVVDAKTISRLAQEAAQEAPMRVEIGMRRAAEAMDHLEIAQ